MSWTGTMFEYMMPSLWMRTFPNTLLSNTLAACVRVQQVFARSVGIPWGISESGNAQRDDAGHYQYHAFGIPQIAASWEAKAGPVVSPYSTFLALEVDTDETLRNLRRMASAGWLGAYGFYEAVDYSTGVRNGEDCARMDGPSPGNVAAGPPELPERRRHAAMVPFQHPGAIGGIALARNPPQQIPSQSHAQRLCLRASPRAHTA